MKRIEWKVFGLIILGFLAGMAGCAGGSDQGVPGDEDTAAEQEAADGTDKAETVTEQESETVTEEETTEATDADEAVDIEEPNGSISGKVKSSPDYASYNKRVKLYKNNPFEVWNAQPYRTTKDFVELDKEYAFNDIPSSTYYLMVEVDVGNDDKTTNGVLNDVLAVYPDKVFVVGGDPLKKDIINVDLYAGSQNPDWGSMAGTLHIADNFLNKRIIVVVAKERPSEIPGDPISLWPSSVDFITPAKAPPPVVDGDSEGDAAETDEATEDADAEISDTDATELTDVAETADADETAETDGEVPPSTVAFKLPNLNDGTYYLMAFVDLGESKTPPLYLSPYGTYEIKVSDPSKKEIKDLTFYVGGADPHFGSISGTLTLASNFDGGQIGVYFFGCQASALFQPISGLFIEKTSAKTYTYTVGNLNKQDCFLAAGFYVIDEAFPKTSLATAIYPHALAIPAPTGEAADGDAESEIETILKKDHTGIDFTVPVTELSGNVHLGGTGLPADAGLMARLALVSPDKTSLNGPFWAPFWQGMLELPASGQRDAAFKIFPVYGGDWIPTLIIDTDKNGIDPAKDITCTSQSKKLVGEQKKETAEFFFDMGSCVTP